MDNIQNISLWGQSTLHRHRRMAGNKLSMNLPWTQHYRTDIQWLDFLWTVWTNIRKEEPSCTFLYMNSPLLLILLLFSSYFVHSCYFVVITTSSSANWPFITLCLSLLSCFTIHEYMYLPSPPLWEVWGLRVIYDIVCYLTPFWVILFLPHVILLV